MSQSNRRRFLVNGGAGAAMGLANFGFLGSLPSVAAQETNTALNIAPLADDIAPVVRWIEDTPRERLLEKAAQEIKRGLSYRDLLAALMLAGVRNIEPRPSVGFKFHAVLVVNSAHLASISSPPEHRWLPIFWALDHFRDSAERDVRERGDWTMKPLDDAKLPAPHRARQTFQEAMDDWDEGKADAAAAQLARSASASEVYEMMWRYGMRDYRSIGHKAIYVANSWRTLQCIGWRHAEPIVRSLAYALLMHEGGNPAKRDAEADRPYRRNQQLVDKIRPGWRSASASVTERDSAANHLMEVLRTGSNDDACDQVVQVLNSGAGPQAVWDALLGFAGELLMRQPGIVGLHAVTTTNALHYAYQTTSDDHTRRLLMLQNAAFLPMFLTGMRGRGAVNDATLESLQPTDGFRIGPDSAAKIFHTLGENRELAASQALAYLEQGGDVQELINTARLLVFSKGDDAHDYKFSSAVLEDFHHLSGSKRNAYLAANIFLLNDAQRRDNKLVERIRAAMA